MVTIPPRGLWNPRAPQFMIFFPQKKSFFLHQGCLPLHSFCAKGHDRRFSTLKGFLRWNLVSFLLEHWVRFSWLKKKVWPVLPLVGFGEVVCPLLSWFAQLEQRLQPRYQTHIWIVVLCKICSIKTSWFYFWINRKRRYVVSWAEFIVPIHHLSRVPWSSLQQKLNANWTKNCNIK